MLDKAKDRLVNRYVQRTGKPAAEIAAMMDDETWLNGEEALDGNFVDSLIEDVSAAISIPEAFGFKNPPRAAVAPTQRPKNRIAAMKRQIQLTRARLLN